MNRPSAFYTTDPDDDLIEVQQDPETGEFYPVGNDDDEDDWRERDDDGRYCYGISDDAIAELYDLDMGETCQEYVEGMNARELGKPIAANPYGQTQRGKSWKLGWDAGLPQGTIDYAELRLLEAEFAREGWR